MVKNFGEEARPEEEDENSPKKSDLHPELQEKIDRLERLESGQHPKWLENVEEIKAKLRQEIALEQEVQRQREEIQQERDKSIEERFGPDVLRSAEVRAQEMGENIKIYLAETEDRSEALEILKLWEKFNHAVNTFLIDEGVKPQRHKEALEKISEAASQDIFSKHRMKPKK